MLELRPFGEPYACPWLSKFDGNVLVAAGIKRTDCVEDFLPFIA